MVATLQPNLVSIVVPTYNCRDFLAECLESLLAQSWQHFEVLIVDDCSTDGTRDYILERSAVEPRFRPLLQEQNRGPAAARNAGIRAAQGEYVAFLDADDRWAKSKLARQLELMAQAPAVGLCATNGAIIDRHGARLGPLFEPGKIRNGRIPAEDYLLAGLPIVTSSVLLRRAVLDQVGGFKEAYRVAEDFELWFRVLRVSEIRFIDEDLTLYRLHDSNITGNKVRNRLSKVRILDDEITADPAVAAELGPAFWLDLQRKYCSLGKMLLQDGQRELGRTYLDKAIRLKRNLLVSLKAWLYQKVY